MRRSPERGRASTWVFGTVMVTLFVVSILYMALYWWPHSQGRSSSLDKYAPAVRAFLEKLGWAPKTQGVGAKGSGKAPARPVSTSAIRNAILDSSEWVNYSELDDIQTSGGSATVLVRGRMTDTEALRAAHEIFGVCFEKVGNLASLRVVVRVKGRSAAGSGRFVDALKSDITLTRGTYEKLNWASVTPARLPKVADRAKLY